ncbi:MAG: hypothetical protein NC924_01335 [Candidatus Omnitrophica bacterium]|nr:hypothetical protein [Candidatus Omnitrophota bacterium]
MVELLVAISVLSVGIVFIVRSFLSNVGAIEVSGQYVLAAQLLDRRMSACAAARLQGEALREQHAEEAVRLGLHPAVLIFDVQAESFDELADAWQAEAPADVLVPPPARDMYKVQARIQWQSAARQRSLAVTTYLRDEKP